jgi:hypothetical protein
MERHQNPLRAAPVEVRVNSSAVASSACSTIAEPSQAEWQAMKATLEQQWAAAPP